MKAVICTEARLEVDDIPPPIPVRGQVLIDVSRCGICGSDLHARVHADEMAELAAETGYRDFMRSHQRVVLGHEFSGTVAGYGPGCRKRWPAGTAVVALPIVRTGSDIHLTGLSASAPGGYAEQVVVQESMTLPVPNGLSTEAAALTEPMAVAWHAVREGEVGKRRTPIVIGCGPIGLAVISMLKASGVRTVVAADFSPRRRELAAAMRRRRRGRPCHGVAVDVLPDAGRRRPSRRYSPSGWTPWRSCVESRSCRGGMSSPRRRGGATPRGRSSSSVSACPESSTASLAGAPLRSRVVVVGVCMETDTFRPAMAINKEIDLRFVIAYKPASSARHCTCSPTARSTRRR